MTRRRGFTAVEVVVSILVLAFAAIPIISMMSSGRRTAALTEYHILAQRRALRYLETMSTYTFNTLRTIPRKEGGALKLNLPGDESAFPKDYRKKCTAYEEKATLLEVRPGLLQATVKVSWELAGQSKKTITLHRLYGDESLSLSDSYPLRQKGVAK